MSLHLHLSARSNDLLARLRPHLAAARKLTLAHGTGIPRPVPVLLPSAQMGDWLQVRLARDLGLSMGFEFLQPAAYLKRHATLNTPEAEFAKAHAFWAPDQLRWHLLPAIDAFAPHLGQSPSDNLSPRDRFAFAQLLGRQFDRYIRHRPDWPSRWEINQPAWPSGPNPPTSEALEDEAWQRALWRTVSESPEALPHPATLLNELANTPSPSAASTPPLFVIATDQLDPLFLRSLQCLAYRGQTVELYLLLPSLGYLGDISRRNRLRTQLESNASTTNETLLESATHPLLASLGQQAVGTFSLLGSITEDYSEWPAAVVADNDLHLNTPLLGRLQSDIREQRPPVGPATSPDQPDSRPPLRADDASLRIHCCHSPRRELEVLRDELLRAFADVPGLLPEEVLIAVTDFDAYAPLADAILRSGPQPLPVRLTAITAREANPIAVALLAILKVSQGRRTASDVIELLNLSAVQQHLDLDSDTHVLAHLADAVRHSGLTYGLDESDRPASSATGTWRAALDRHLAGAWFGPVADVRDSTETFVHPIASELHHDDEALARFLTWLTQLARHLRAWEQPASAAEWAERLGALADELLASEVNDDHAAAMRRLFGELAAVRATTPLDAGAMLDWLQPQLDNATSLRTSMGGEILFGRLDQLHGLPCRVLAILGLQDGAFPRAARRPAWDLLAHRPERSDGDPRTQDRQRFLDGLLNPSDRLILSAANRSLRTAHDGPLSSCVEELLRVITATVRPADGFDTVQQQIVLQHRLHPFAVEYFITGPELPPSFDAVAARITSDITDGNVQPAPPFSSTASAAPLAAIETLTLAQLISFWKNPARAYLKGLTLETWEDENDDATLDHAPLHLDNLQAYAVRSAALATHLFPDRNSAVAASSRLSADRALPPGELGVLTWERHNREILPLAQSVAPLLPQVSTTLINVSLADGTLLTGDVQLAHDPGDSPWILLYRPSNYEDGPKYQVEALITTAAATVQLGHPVICRVAGLDVTTPKNLPTFSVDDAIRLLENFVAGYRAGLEQPLCYSPNCSNDLAKSLVRDGDAETALQIAMTKWLQEPFDETPAGDGLAPTARLAWRDTDPFAPPYADAWLAWAQSIAVPLAQWWTWQAGPTLKLTVAPAPTHSATGKP